MIKETALAIAALAAATGAAAQAPAPQPQRPNIPALLNAGYDLKAVMPSRGPCGDQPANRAQTCVREVYYFQSPNKNMIYRCELGPWNGGRIVDCDPIR
jgi:hypothetical protein